MDSERQQLRQKFLSACEMQNVSIEPLAQDASFRRYFRITQPSQSTILMDAPPDKENIQAFIKVAEHLHGLSLNAPQIYHVDIRNGFILMEDFGDNTFTKLLSQNHDETRLYSLALNQLVKLHKHAEAVNIALADYSTEVLIDEALLLCDWYYPQIKGAKMSKQNRDAYIECWQGIIASLPVQARTLVLRDFHVDNLILLKDQQCGLLDFQDALIGSPAYDLVSLLEDARRDISLDLQKKLTNEYFDQFEQLDRSAFLSWYKVLGAQRHCKVLGIFTRLSVRDNKHHYLAHIGRVEGLLKTHLDFEYLLPLTNWLKQNNLFPIK